MVFYIDAKGCETQEFIADKGEYIGVLGNKNEAESLRSKIVDAGKEIQMTIEKLQQNDSIKQDIKYFWQWTERSYLARSHHNMLL